jgi:nucleoside diphosphate kinase
MRIMEAAIQRATVKSTIAGFEHVGLRAGRAPLLCLRVREGVEQHVDVDTDKGVPVELVRHITSNFKNKLHFL